MCVRTNLSPQNTDLHLLQSHCTRDISMECLTGLTCSFDAAAQLW